MPERLSAQGVEFQLASMVAMIPWSMKLGFVILDLCVIVLIFVAVSV